MLILKDVWRQSWWTQQTISTDFPYRNHNHNGLNWSTFSERGRCDQTITRAKREAGRVCVRGGKMCLLSSYPCLSCEIGEGRLYYWTPVPVPANDLTLIDLFNAHFIAGNPLPRFFLESWQNGYGLPAHKELKRGGGDYCSEITSTQSFKTAFQSSQTPWAKLKLITEFLYLSKIWSG